MTETQEKQGDKCGAYLCFSTKQKRLSDLIVLQGCIIIHTVESLLHAKARNIILWSCAAGRIAVVLGYRGYAATA